MDIFLYFIYTGVFLITLHFLSLNNNRLYFLFKAILLASFIVTGAFTVSLFIENQPVIQNERIRLVFDRVVSSEILLSLISFSLVLLTISCKNVSLKIQYTILSIIIISLQTLLLIYLKTRTSWIAYIIILTLLLCFVFAFYRQEVNYKRLFLSLLIAICLSGIIYWEVLEDSGRERIGLKDTFSSIIDKDYYTNKARINFWNATLKMFMENPITGIGRGNWQGLYPKYDGHFYTDANIVMNSAVNPHNEYLEILAEYGILGFVIFTAFILTGLYLLLINGKKEIIIMPFLLTSVGIIIAMFFSFPAENVWAYFVFMISMAVGYSGVYNKFKGSNNGMSYIVAIIGFAFLVSGIWFGFMKHYNEKTYLEAMQLKTGSNYAKMLDKLTSVSDFYYPVDMNKMPVDYYRGIGYFELKQYEKALELFRSARERMKYYPMIMNNEAAALYMTGNYEEAEKRYNEIRNIFPNYIEPKINLLAFYVNQKRIREAIEIISEIETKSFDSKFVKNYSVFLEIKDYFKRNKIQ